MFPPIRTPTVAIRPIPVLAVISALSVVVKAILAASAAAPLLHVVVVAAALVLAALLVPVLRSEVISRDFVEPGVGHLLIKELGQLGSSESEHRKQDTLSTPHITPGTWFVSFADFASKWAVF